ncbi:diguanylate cyclase [Agrobacterium larrymoorei]|uniref:diguanylate cyclase n=1 Tax=Agrobacterium larrymoorei TaxID=160699 RepID=A0AAF0HCR8_9HYPH|nr:diguanylate cyclase [Agrobacterium larrymoorei]WHA43673.1 diguanylate cyclase [Agrobacterium larrymoorei]
MRISAITNWAYIITVALTLLAGGSFILSSSFADLERRAVEQHLMVQEIADELDIAAEKRSDDIRLYVMRGDEAELAAFYVDENAERGFEALAEKARTNGATEQEQALLTDIARQAEALDEIEERAIAEMRQGQRTAAQQIVFGDEHNRLQTALLADVEKLSQILTARTGAVLEDAKEKSDIFGLLARIMLTLTAIVFLSVLYFVVKKRIANPIVTMTGVINRLARQEFDVEVPHLDRRDEIGEMNAAIEVFRANGLERERLDAELRKDQRIKDLILQMMHRLQACQAEHEIAGIVSLYMPQIFPDMAGALFIQDETHSNLLVRGTWREPKYAKVSLQPSDCWGLRRGRPHLGDPADNDVICPHLSASDLCNLCVPLTALGDIVGLLSLEAEDRNLVINARVYLELIAENLGLAIANLQLRERLTGLATRDALTGLLNRRSLDEAINRLGKREPQGNQSCLMLDIDHFKRFNDEFGHDAGDAVIKHVASILVSAGVEQSEVYRFGGEEFTVLLDGLSEDEATAFAESLREKVAKAPLSDRGRFLGVVTISIGVASAPEQGTVNTLVTRADAALLIAKERGRNRTVRSSSLVKERV